MNFSFQPARLRDVPGIARVHVDTWRTTYRGLVPDSYLETLSYEKRETMWRGFIENRRPRCQTWVVKNTHDEVLGFCDAGPTRSPAIGIGGEINAIYLRKEFQGKGLGKELLLHAFEQLFRDGFYQSTLWVLADNPTLNFYLALGGKVVSERSEDIGGKSCKELAIAWDDILATVRKYRPNLRHPNIKHFSELQKGDGTNHYPGSGEFLSRGAPFANHMGLTRLGIHHETLLPGRRTSWPHAEEDEDEFVYVIEGHPHVWIDGEIFALNPGDGIAFPCGTGVSQTFMNNSSTDVRLLVIGEAAKSQSRIFYPMNPVRKEQCGGSWWHDVPPRKMGMHDGLPDVLRGKPGEK